MEETTTWEYQFAQLQLYKCLFYFQKCSVLPHTPPHYYFLKKQRLQPISCLPVPASLRPWENKESTHHLQPVKIMQSCLHAGESFSIRSWTFSSAWWQCRTLTSGQEQGFLPKRWLKVNSLQKKETACQIWVLSKKVLWLQQQNLVSEIRKRWPTKKKSVKEMKQQGKRPTKEKPKRNQGNFIFLDGPKHPFQNLPQYLPPQNKGSQKQGADWWLWWCWAMVS